MNVFLFIISTFCRVSSYNQYRRNLAPAFDTPDDRINMLNEAHFDHYPGAVMHMKPSPLSPQYDKVNGN